MSKSVKRFLSVVLAITMMMACFVVAPATTVSAATTDEIAIEATSVDAMPGDTVKIDINITSNPGIVAMRLFVEYDESLLTLVGAEDKGVLGTSQFTEEYGSPFALVWSNGTATSNYTVTGTIATLTFKVADNFEKNTVATVSLSTKSANDILSVDTNTMNLVSVTPKFTTGKVNVYPFAFYGAAITLYDNIGMSFLVTKKLIDNFGYTDPYVVFQFNDKEITQYNCKEYDANNYYFEFSDIGPKQLKDVLSATLYATKNGELVSSPVKNYSVAEYCYSAIEYYTTPAYAEVRTLAVDLLNFGAAVQEYDKYKTDNLANAELTEAQKAMGTQTAPTLATDANTTYETIDNPSVGWYSAGLYLYDTVEMRFYISTPNANGLRAKVQSAKTGKTWYIENSEFKKYSNGYYYFDFDKFQAIQMREVVYVTILNGDTPVSNTLSYDIESYAYSVSNSQGNEILKKVTDAMMKYGDSAYNFRY